MEQIITKNGIKLYTKCKDFIFNYKYVAYIGKIKYNKKEKNYMFIPVWDMISVNDDTIKEIYYIIQNLKRKHKL